MNRLACALLLVLCSSATLSAQSEAIRIVIAAVTPTVVHFPPPDPSDTLFAGKPLIERMVGGAVVGAVTGGTLRAQKSDCVPRDSPVEAIAVGAVFGAIRGAFKLGLSDDDPPMDTRGGGGEAGPFPFDGKICRRAET